MKIIQKNDLHEESSTDKIFGEEILATEIATKTNTIPYEVLTGISERVKRVFFVD